MEHLESPLDLIELISTSNLADNTKFRYLLLQTLAHIAMNTGTIAMYAHRSMPLDNSASHN